MMCEGAAALPDRTDVDADDIESTKGTPSVRVRLVQHVALGTSPAERLSRMREYVLSMSFAASGNSSCTQPPSNSAANVLVLPEMWPVGFFNFDGYKSFATKHYDEYYQLLGEFSRRLNCWTFGGSAPFRRGEDYFNRSVVVSPAGAYHYFDKLHLFTYHSREAEILSRGSRLVAFASPLGMTGVLTCFDLRFPESFRALREKGCQAFVIVAAWPKPRVAHWKALLVARAIENQAWVIGVNGSGVDFGTELGGGSMIVGPDGSVVLDLADERASRSTMIEAGLTDQTRAQFPFHDSTIPDLLGHSSAFPVVRSA